jgi:hypothetical protein
VRKSVVGTPLLNTEKEFFAVITAALESCRATPASARIALTFPLPTGPEGRIQGRDKWHYFGGLTRPQIGKDLQAEFGFESVCLPHDSEAQAEYVEVFLHPAGLYGVMAFGTSIAFSLRVAGQREITSGLNSTFSHIETGEGGQPCPTCGRPCLGQNYKEHKEAPGAPFILRAIGIAARLPLSRLYLAGGALADSAARAPVRKLVLPVSASPVQIVPKPEFSGAIGAALLAR